LDGFKFVQSLGHKAEWRKRKGEKMKPLLKVFVFNQFSGGSPQPVQELIIIVASSKEEAKKIAECGVVFLKETPLPEKAGVFWQG
jgi:hypothetical protein